MSGVTAVVVAGAHHQPVAPDGQLEEVVTVSSLGAIRQAASAATTTLLWLVDESARPDDETLAVLLDNCSEPVASLPVDGEGRPVEALTGRITESDVPGILDAVGRNRVPLRHTHVTSLLLERDRVLELAPPDPRRFGWYAGAEWTARLFARRPGMLVPRSRVTVNACPTGSVVHLLRAARTARWRSGETIRELHRIAGGSR